MDRTDKRMSYYYQRKYFAMVQNTVTINQLITQMLDVLLNLKHFHVFLKDSDMPAYPDCVELFHAKYIGRWLSGVM